MVFKPNKVLQLLFCVHTLSMNYITKIFLLVSSSNFVFYVNFVVIVPLIKSVFAKEINIMLLKNANIIKLIQNTIFLASVMKYAHLKTAK